LTGKDGSLEQLHAESIAALTAARYAEAARLIERALAIDARQPALHSNLGNALQGLGRYAEAEASYQRALALDPGMAEVHNNRGNALRALGRPDEAEASYRRALAINPGYAGAALNLGKVLAATARTDEACAIFERLLASHPRHGEALSLLGSTLHRLGRNAEAVKRYEQALAAGFRDAETLNGLGNALHELLRLDEAGERYREAIAAEPTSAEAHSNLGNLALELGKTEEAADAFARAVLLAPRRGRYHRYLVETRRIEADAPELAALRRLQREIASLPPEDQIELHFAWGKVQDDLGNHESAFAHFQAGHALQRRRIAYDEPATMALFERIRATFTAELLRSRRNLGTEDARPIFIVGMMRSGTSLAEQILASHPQVFGAGELDFFERAMADHLPVAFPEAFAGLDAAAALRDIGADYGARLATLAGTADRITDKMPANFRYVGAIHLVLPQARIVHMRRDPVDTCLSCFTKLFADEHGYTHDLGELGRYWRAYDRMMAHWRAVLPAGVMLDLDYEALVADLEPQARRLLAHCGLSWDRACLAFDKTERAVRTASAAQVRRPIYRSAVGRWRAYGPDALGPLFDGLGIARDD
jgi:tetratricopeptide (TPR) repeat protein